MNRIIVTGRTPEGKDVIVRDDEVDQVTIPGVGQLARLWSADGPGVVPNDGRDPGAPDHFPPPGGYRLMIITLPPDAELAAQAADLSDVAADLDIDSDGDSPGMHRTDTTDFVVVLSGQLEVELESGASVVAAAGDVVVQNGTRHRIGNPGQVPVVIATVIVGAHSADPVEGNALT